MRTTQFIGLTAHAKEFLEANTIGEPERFVLTEGIAGEPVHGQRWPLRVPEGPNEAYYATEIVQVAPWSSGPMIFTCLNISLVKIGGDTVDCGKAFEWVWNPDLKGEVDEVAGHYNV